jgi:phage tail P2-like protein
MTLLSDRPSLLPPNASAAERAIEASTAQALDLPVDVGKLWNPSTCPLALLPWLAWAFSVDRWDAGWPEAVKRQVIAASPVLHRRKGTRAAVAEALAALYVRADIVEWFEQEPMGDPGTFVIRAYARSALGANEAVLSHATIAAIRAIVSSVAPISRKYRLEIGVDVASQLRAAAAVARSVRIAPRRLNASTLPDRQAGFGVTVSAPRTLRITQLRMGAAA